MVALYPSIMTIALICWLVFGLSLSFSLVLQDHSSKRHACSPHDFFYATLIYNNHTGDEKRSGGSFPAQECGGCLEDV